MNKRTPNSHHIESKPATLLILALLLTAFLGAIAVYAGPESGGTGSETGRAAHGIACVLCRIANLIFLIIASLAAVVIILAGLKWLTSGDDPGARNAAKTTIVSAFVGIIIVFIAVFVVAWVMQGLGGNFYVIKVDQWIDPGACDNECTLASGGGETPETPETPTNPPAGTCEAACGTGNFMCLADCGLSAEKGQLDCNAGEKCCCIL